MVTTTAVLLEGRTKQTQLKIEVVGYHDTIVEFKIRND